MTAPSVYFIVVHWNNLVDTMECLDSIGRCSYPYYKVILVNNNATPLPRNVQSEHQNLQIIEAGDNLGYTGGNNLGIHLAIGEKADYIFVLNNDTVIDPHCLQPLITFCEQNPKTVVSPLMYLYGSNAINAYGGRIIYPLAICRLITHPHRQKSPDFLSGACLFARRQDWDAIGDFNSLYFSYMEDVDWSLRARQKGYRLKVIPESIIYHKKSASTKVENGWGPVKAYYIARNTILLGKKALKGIKGTLWIFAYCLFGAPLHLIFFSRSVETSKQLIKGVLDGLRQS